MLGRGLLKRCARCGLSFEHEEGYWVGAMTVAIVVVLALSIVAMGAIAIVTWPEIPVLEVVLVGVIANIVFPIAFYPFSKTLWVAIDLAWFNTDQRRK
jgi:uncharacterized protein (DUF983 family)